MKGQSPRQLALITALIIAVITFIIVTIAQALFQDEIYWIELLTVAIFVFISAWFVIYKVLQQFIYRKVKLIFRNMHLMRVERDTFKFDMGTDVLGEVNKKVADWAEDRLAEIKDLQDKENFRKEFVGNVAHELKTPIFSIQGYILTLLEGALEDPNFNRKFLRKAAKSVERMTLLVEDLDTITQFESGSLKLKMEKVNVVEVTKEIFESQDQQGELKAINVGFDRTYDKPIMVNIDAFRIGQVLVNLITNSIKYGKEGGRTHVRFFDLGEQILVEVSDNGPGIEKEHLPRLFERFYRVDKSRARSEGGTGLGLAICKHIIEAHKQSISVRSEVGKGSVFSFTLEKA